MQFDCSKGDEQNLSYDQVQFEKPIFKAYFADATESISQIFFIKDFSKVDREEEEDSYDNDDRSRESETDQNPRI